MDTTTTSAQLFTKSLTLFSVGRKFRQVLCIH